MEARATLREGRMSVGVMMALLALAATFLLGAGGGYFVKAVTSPAVTQTHVITIPAGTPKQTILPNES
jgi:hypothetical protein